MKNTNSIFLKKRRWKKQLIGFCAFIGGFLLSSMVYLSTPIIDGDFGEQKVAGEPRELFLEETLIRLNQSPTEEPIRGKKEQSDENSKEEIPEKSGSDLLWGFDFTADHQPVTIEIFAEEARRNIDLPIKISFLPDEHCEFGDGRACIYSISSSHGNQIILASVHSGVGAEAEAFRHYLEGTGFSQGQYELPQVIAHAQSLEGSVVHLLQGDQITKGLEIISVLRIPPENLDAYMALPVEEIITNAVEILGIDPDIFNQSLLIIETCGWQLPDEDLIAGHMFTSNSVYLGLIGLRNR